jgi:hypothetical protein
MFKFGTMHMYIEPKFVYMTKKIIVMQKGYVHKMLTKFGMLNCHHVETPMEEGRQL